MSSGLDKKEFVDRYLKPTFIAAGAASGVTILDMEYIESSGGYRESIVITYKGGYKEVINVSMDSHLAMIHDIVKQTKEF